jgi:hypothetical protein
MLYRRSLIKFGLLLTVARIFPAAAKAGRDPLTQGTAAADARIHALIFKREMQTVNFFAVHTVTVETDVQIARISPLCLVFPGPPLHFLDRVDLSVLSRTAPKVGGVRTGNIMTRFNPSGFADRAFLDPQGFTPARYKLNFLSSEPCQNGLCSVYHVTPQPKARHHAPGPFFTGTIWVETTDFTVIRFRGNYVPASHIDRTLSVHNHFLVDAYRFEAGQHLWLPNRIYSSNTGKKAGWFFPQFEAQTSFSDYKLNQPRFTEIPINSSGAESVLPNPIPRSTN